MFYGMIKSFPLKEQFISTDNTILHTKNYFMTYVNAIAMLFTRST